MNNILLIRHGESQANAGESTPSPLKNELTPRGQQQAEQCAAAIPDEPNQIVVTPYLRSSLAALPIHEKYPGAAVVQLNLHEFTYIDPDKCIDTNRFDRLSWKQAYWERCDPVYRDGNAESFQDFMTRVQTGINWLVEQQGLVVVVTHGHVIRAMIWQVLKGALEYDRQAMADYYHLRRGLYIPNGTMVTVNFSSRVISGLLTTHLEG